MTLQTEKPDLTSLFENIPSSAVSDSMGRLAGTSTLAPRHGKQALLGTALTVRVRSGDNLFIHEALRHVSPGSVIVIDGGGCTERALIGEIIMVLARKRGAVGFVVDGAVRDVAAFRDASFPCYARGVTHRGPYKDGPGEIGGTVVIDGQVVHPGDIVLGDEDGVLFIRPHHASELAAAARRKLDDEACTLKAIEDDNYDESWIAPALAKSLPVRN